MADLLPWKMIAPTASSTCCSCCVPKADIGRVSLPDIDDVVTLKQEPDLRSSIQPASAAAVAAEVAMELSTSCCCELRRQTPRGQAANFYHQQIHVAARSSISQLLCSEGVTSPRLSQKNTKQKPESNPNPNQVQVHSAHEVPASPPRLPKTNRVKRPHFQPIAQHTANPPIPLYRSFPQPANNQTPPSHFIPPDRSPASADSILPNATQHCGMR